MEGFKRFIEICDKGKHALCADEAIFSSNQFNQKTWYPQNAKCLIKKKKIGFKAIAVVAAVDRAGKVVALHMRERSIDSDAFVVFLKKVGVAMKRRKCYMLVDNLITHRTDDVREQARKSNIELIFNGTYSSDYNAIERLWSFSKHRFYKTCIDEA